MSLSSDDLELFGPQDEVFLPTRRRQGVPTPIPYEIVRELAPADLQELVIEPAPAPEIAVADLSRVRSAHHLLAQLIAEGKSNIEIGFITGYNPSYISGLKSDPTFKELLAHYSSVREKVYVDALERMKLLGLSSLEELQQRLEESPKDFAINQLLEIAKVLLVNPQGQKAAAQASAPAISVTFVQPQQGTGPGAGPMIDLSPNPEPGA